MSMLKQHEVRTTFPRLEKKKANYHWRTLVLHGRGQDGAILLKADTSQNLLHDRLNLLPTADGRLTLTTAIAWRMPDAKLHL